MEQFNKSVKMVLKQDTEEKGIIEGQLVTHSVIDSYGDYFDKTALDKVDKDKTYFLLHMHNWSKEIGTLKVYQDEAENLKFSAKLDLSTDEKGNALNLDAQKVYSMMKNNGANYEMSVGGLLKQREWGKVQTDKGEIEARIIKEFEVIEGSVVLKGAVPGATVQTVKGENINKNEGDDNMPKNIEDLEKGMNKNTDDIKKANEDLATALKKNEELEDKINKANEELESMGKALDEVMKKGIANLETEEKKEIGAFEKFLKTGDRNIEGLIKAPIMTTGVTPILMPSVLANEILKELKETSNFLMKGKIVTLKEKSIIIPVRNEITEANEIVKEGAGNTRDGSLAYSQIEITAGMRQVRYPVTDETRADTAFDIVGEIKEAISEEFGQTLSALTLKGTYNTTTEQCIEGFLTNTDVLAGAITTGAANKVTWEDMVKLETGMKLSYRQGSAYYVSPKLYEEMKLWKDANGVPLWNTIRDGATMRFNGYPVYVEEFLDEIATGKYPAVFCDFGKGYTYVMKQNFEQELDRNPDKRITTFFTRIRIGGKVTRAKAFSVLKVK